MRRFQATLSVKSCQSEFVGTAEPDPQEFLKKNLDSRFRAWIAAERSVSPI
jgi:hypothetical protein